jgi:hypothetical protein
MTRIRTEITIETHEIIIIRRTGKQRTAFCQSCQSDVAVFSPNEIAMLAQIAAKENRSKAREVHFVEMPDGRQLMCGNSLKQLKPYSKNAR